MTRSSVGRLIFEQVRTGGDRNFGYLLADREVGHGILVDPSYAPELLHDRARAQGLTITHIVNTHGHPDHTNGNGRAAELTGAQLAAHPTSAEPIDVPLSDGQTLRVGDLRVTCLHTPGHCDDHLVLYESGHQILITGDLLFVGKVGGAKTDDDARAEWTSLQRVLKALPDTATVWPGHDYGARPSSTIGLEKQTNPFLLCADCDSFLQLRQEWPSFKQINGLK